MRPLANHQDVSLAHAAIARLAADSQIGPGIDSGRLAAAGALIVAAERGADAADFALASAAVTSLQSSICDALVEQVRSQIDRVRQLGGWPERITIESLIERIPRAGDEFAPGLDAGLLCALNKIPPSKQRLSAALHSAYTPELIAEVRCEMAIGLDADSEACWWLAGCSVCREGEINQSEFIQQLLEFEELIIDPVLRRDRASREYVKMLCGFAVGPFGPDVPYGVKDGAIQGAYLAGYPFGVRHDETHGTFYIGSLYDLGLDEFPWSQARDGSGRPRSGPVYGSAQYVRCADPEELQAALRIVLQQPRITGALEAMRGGGAGR